MHISQSDQLRYIYIHVKSTLVLIEYECIYNHASKFQITSDLRNKSMLTMYIIFQDFSYYYGFFPYIHGQIVSIYICWFCIYGCFSIAVTDEMGYTVKNK